MYVCLLNIEYTSRKTSLVLKQISRRVGTLILRTLKPLTRFRVLVLVLAALLKLPLLISKQLLIDIICLFLIYFIIDSLLS